MEKNKYKYYLYPGNYPHFLKAQFEQYSNWEEIPYE